MGISGFMEARCRECNCVFNWYCDSNWLFVDSELVGTCDKCMNKESHDCIHENIIKADESFAVVGRKEFPKNKALGNEK